MTTKIMLPSDAPPWMKVGWKEIGTHEVGDNRGPDIQRYINIARCGAVGQPWCAIFENFMLESCGIKGTRSPSSQSFRHSVDFVPLEGPAFGAIVVYYRNGRNSGLGHVGNYVGERGGLIWTLGGNENDMVQIEPLAKLASSFGLWGYFWPASLPKPAIVPVQLAADIPAHQVTVT